MNLKKKCSIVMLPTEKGENCFLLSLTTEKISYEKSYFTQEYLKSVNKKSYHLHILSDDKIKEGDNYFTILDGVFKGYRICSKTDILPKNAKKIIASTDKSLNLPQPSPPPQFIQKYCDEYNKGNQIVDVMVEYTKKYNQPVTKNYEKTGDLFITEEPKVDKNNYITITKIKDSWNREEVSKAIHDCMILANSQEIGRLQAFIDEWIKDNL